MVVIAIIIMFLAFFILSGCAGISGQLDKIINNQTEIIKLMKNK